MVQRDVLIYTCFEVMLTTRNASHLVYPNETMCKGAAANFSET